MGEVAANATIPALATPSPCARGHAVPAVIIVVVATVALTASCLPLSGREQKLAVAMFAASLGLRAVS
jgi:hypothetical protein